MGKLLKLRRDTEQGLVGSNKRSVKDAGVVDTGRQPRFVGPWKGLPQRKLGLGRLAGVGVR